MNTHPVCIYHNNCLDGTTAAAVFTRKFPEGKTFPLDHASEPEDIAKVVEEIPEGAQVFIIDCAIGVREVLTRGHEVVVLDHHKSVREEMEALATHEERLTFIYDVEKSGATLAWNYFFPDEETPLPIKYVEAGDIWNDEYGEEGRRVTSYLNLFRNDEPKVLLALLDESIEILEERGKGVRKYIDDDIERWIEFSPVALQIGPHEVHAYNIAAQRAIKSPAGNRLAERDGEAAAMFTIRGGEVTFAFRSIEGQHPSARELAELLGGGGHEHSAGAGISLSEFLKMVKTS